MRWETWRVLKDIIWVPSAVVGTEGVFLHGQCDQDGIKPHQAVMEQREEEDTSSTGNSVSQGAEARACGKEVRGGGGGGGTDYQESSGYCREIFWAPGCRYAGPWEGFTEDQLVC